MINQFLADMYEASSSESEWYIWELYGLDLDDMSRITCEDVMTLLDDEG